MLSNHCTWLRDQHFLAREDRRESFRICARSLPVAINGLAASHSFMEKGKWTNASILDQSLFFFFLLWGLQLWSRPLSPDPECMQLSYHFYQAASPNTQDHLKPSILSYKVTGCRKWKWKASSSKQNKNKTKIIEETRTKNNPIQNT